ncbi:MAG: hypothetical protein ACYCW6_15330 [Candidatus Xenobia bacterium]
MNLSTTVADWLRGTAGRDELELACIRTAAAYAELRADFERVVGVQPYGVLGRCERDVMAVVQRLDACDGVLRRLTEAVAAPRPDAVRHLDDELQAAAEALDAAIKQFRDNAATAMGPTRHGGINLVLQAAGLCLEGADAWDALLHAIRALPLAGPELEAAARERNRDQLSHAIADLDVEQTVSELEWRATPGPTLCPPVNHLLALARSGAPLEAALEAFSEELARLHLEGQEMARAADSVLLREEWGRLEDALTDLVETLAELPAATPDRLDRLASRLALRVAAVDASRAALEAMAETEERIPCLQCDALNDQRQLRCRQCSARLPIQPLAFQPEGVTV